MKKLFVLLILLLFGCATSSQLSDLEQRVALLESAQMGEVGARFYPAHSLTGSAAGDLDNISATVDGDAAFVQTDDGETTYGAAFFAYSLDATTGSQTEAVPAIIDAADADEDWELADLYGSHLLGRISWGTSISGAVTLGDELTEVWGRMYLVTAACTVTMEDAATVGYGACVGFFVRDAAETLVIDVDDADKINLHGTAQAAGASIDSPGNAGDFIFMISTTDADGSGTDGWITLGYGKEPWSAT